jgi:hypothetical protein
LYLPPTVQENEAIQSGYVVKAGPGYPIPALTERDEFWKNHRKIKIKYIPLQAKEGDLAVYLQKADMNIEFNNEKYILIPHSSILMIISR